MEEKHMEKKINRKDVIVCALIILIQVAVLICVDASKREYHIDEIYSYLLSNSYDADKISSDETMYNNWISGDRFDEFITVQPGEQFAYQKVYFNNSTDCHPPLFYWLLHTVCSFHPDKFSKWYGLTLNIFLFVIAQIILCLLSAQLITDARLQKLPVVMYGLSVYLLETASFIRMYMLLTVFALLTAYITVRLIKSDMAKRWMIASWIVIYLGAMTQYYALILSFWLVGLITIRLLHRKEFKRAAIYALGALVSVGCVVLSYPYIISQATGSSTNNVGTQVTKNLFNFRLWIEMMRYLAGQVVENISYSPRLSYLICLVGVIVLLVLLVTGKKRDRKIPSEAIVIAVGSILTIVTVSFIGGEYVYLRYIYFVIPLLYCVIFVALDWLVQSVNKKTLWVNILAVVCAVFSVTNAAYGTINRQSVYLYTEKWQEDQMLERYKDTKLVAIVGGVEPAVPTGNLTKFRQFDSLYMGTWDDLERMSIIEQCIEDTGACVVYINTNTYWTKGYPAQELLLTLMQKTSSKTYEKICDGGLGEYYLLQK